MGFFSKQVVGGGSATVEVINNSNNMESVVNAMSAYNSSIHASSVSAYVDSVEVFSIIIPPNETIRIPDKLNVGVSSTFSVLAGKNITANISYMQQVIDIDTATAEVQAIIDNTTNVNTVSTNISAVKDVASVMQSVVDAKSNALAAESAANYKGIWSSTYTDGYAIGDTIAAVDGRRYVSNVASNTTDPVTDTDGNWYRLDVLPAQTGQGGKYLVTDGVKEKWITLQTGVIDCGGATNSSDTFLDGGTATSVY